MLIHYQVIDHRGITIWLNRNDPSISEDMVGSSILKLVHPGDRDAVLLALSETAIIGRSGPLRVRYQMPDGQAVFVATYHRVDHLVIAEAWREREHSLTVREVEVLRLVCEGKRSDEIARSLEIGLPTVETHRRHLREKTGCQNAVQKLRWAIRHGLVEV